MSRNWSEAEIKFLKENYNKLSNLELAVKLFEINGYLYSRSSNSISNKMALLNLRRDIPQAIKTKERYEAWDRQNARYNLRKLEREKKESVADARYFDIKNKRIY